MPMPSWPRAPPGPCRPEVNVAMSPPAQNDFPTARMTRAPTSAWSRPHRTSRSTRRRLLASARFAGLGHSASRLRTAVHLEGDLTGAGHGPTFLASGPAPTPATIT